MSEVRVNPPEPEVDEQDLGGPSAADTEASSSNEVSSTDIHG